MGEGYVAAGAKGGGEVRRHGIEYVPHLHERVAHLVGDGAGEAGVQMGMKVHARQFRALFGEFGDAAAGHQHHAQGNPPDQELQGKLRDPGLTIQ